MVRKLNATIMCTWTCIKFISFSFSCTLVFIGAFFNYTTQFSSLVKVQVFKFNISYTVVYTCRYFLSSHYTISTVLSGYGFTCLTFVVLWYTCRWLLFITLHNCKQCIWTCSHGFVEVSLSILFWIVVFAGDFLSSWNTILWVQTAVLSGSRYVHVKFVLHISYDGILQVHKVFIVHFV